MPDSAHPRLRQVVLDAEDPRGLAEFYRVLLGYAYRRGDEPPPPGEPDERGRDWLVLRPKSGPGIAFRAVASLPRATWPSLEVPQQLHLDLDVGTVEDLAVHHARALELGATELLDRSDDTEEPLYVFADPAGHPFCIFVSPMP